MPFLITTDGPIEVSDAEFRRWRDQGAPPTSGMSESQVRSLVGGSPATAPTSPISTVPTTPPAQSSTADQPIVTPPVGDTTNVTIPGSGESSTPGTGNAQLDEVLRRLQAGTITFAEAQQLVQVITGGTPEQAQQWLQGRTGQTAPPASGQSTGQPSSGAGQPPLGAPPIGAPVGRPEAIAGQEERDPFAAGFRGLLQRPGFAQTPIAFQDFARGQLGNQLTRFHLTSPFDIEGAPAMSFSQFVGQGISPGVGDIRSGLEATLAALMNPSLADPRSAALRTQFQSPTAQAEAAIQPFLMQIAPSLRSSLTSGTGRLLEQQQALQPERQFLDFARQAGFF